MPGFDPRYDPAFQRGYSGPPPELARRPEPVAAQPKETPSQIPNEGDPVGVSPGSPSYGRAESGVRPDAGVRPDEQKAAPEADAAGEVEAAEPVAGVRPATLASRIRHNPSLTALLVLGIVALAAGIASTIVIGQLASTESVNGEDLVSAVLWHQIIGLFAAPLLLGGVLSLVIAAAVAVSTTRRRRP